MKKKFCQSLEESFWLFVPSLLYLLLNCSDRYSQWTLLFVQDEVKNSNYQMLKSSSEKKIIRFASQKKHLSPSEKQLSGKIWGSGLSEFCPSFCFFETILKKKPFFSLYFSIFCFKKKKL